MRTALQNAPGNRGVFSFTGTGNSSNRTKKEIMSIAGADHRTSCAIIAPNAGLLLFLRNIIIWN
jgi:hypothetical protein